MPAWPICALPLLAKPAQIICHKAQLCASASGLGWLGSLGASGRLVLKLSISVLFGFTFKKALFSAFLGLNSFKIIYEFYFIFKSVKISFSVGTGSECWQKMALLVLRRVGLCVGQKPNMPFCATG
jgi:hypothetical protein